MGRSGLAGIDVEKSSSDHLSQTEIGGDNPCSRHLSGISDFLLLAIQIAEGLDAAHAEGGFFFGGFDVRDSASLPVSCLTELRVAEPRLVTLAEALNRIRG